MRDALADIREKIRSGIYRNEEHIRLSLVARILQKLGWNIWDSGEVNSEFKTAPDEDSTRVDLALFMPAGRPTVFIEIKPLGRISGNLSEIEQQLRNYNRDNTALFSIITDGRQWRFYLSQTGGPFSDKCFKVIDVLDDDLDDVELSFYTFLQKTEIGNENAKREAENHLRLTKMERLLEDLLPRARKSVLEPPFPSLPEALVELAIESGSAITNEQAEEFIKENKDRTNQASTHVTDIPAGRTETALSRSPLGLTNQAKSFDPERPPDLTFTSITEACFATENGRNWNNLVRGGVKIAVSKGISIQDLRNLSLPIREGETKTEGYRHVPGTNISVQNSDANRAYRFALLLAKHLRCEVKVRFKWRYREDAAHPGEEGILHWVP